MGRLSPREGSYNVFPPPGAVNESSLRAFCLPIEWLAFLGEQGGITTFMEAVTQALGGELHPKEADKVADRAIEGTLERLRAEGIVVQYDAANGLLYGRARLATNA